MFLNEIRPLNHLLKQYKGGSRVDTDSKHSFKEDTQNTECMFLNKESSLYLLKLTVSSKYLKNYSQDKQSTV